MWNILKFQKLTTKMVFMGRSGFRFGMQRGFFTQNKLLFNRVFLNTPKRGKLGILMVNNVSYRML